MACLCSVPNRGQFLLKDLVLIGVALWTLGEAIGARTKQDTKSADLMET